MLEESALILADIKTDGCTSFPQMLVIIVSDYSIKERKHVEREKWIDKLALDDIISVYHTANCSAKQAIREWLIS